MKNQYFGDIRDLFKYDLAEQIIKEISLVKLFTFIPMLTKNDEGSHGNKTNYLQAKAGSGNKALVSYLGQCVSKNRRNISEIKIYYRQGGIKITIYKENEYFSRKTRPSYFGGVEEKLLSKSLICADPDNGLEIKSSNEKHLLYDEVRQLYSRMNRDSILMLYQYLPRENRKKYFQRRASELKKATGELTIYISDNQVAFFFLTKNTRLKRKLSQALLNYHHLYPVLITNLATPTPKPPKMLL